MNLAISRGYPKDNPANDQFLMALFDDLEGQKQTLSGNPTISNDEQARAYILQFSMKIFLAADNEDRSGQASKKTARMFLVASQFLECMRSFGTIPGEVEERIKYAKWKAMDIVKAINEGRQPQPGPPEPEGEASLAAKSPPTLPVDSVAPLAGQSSPPPVLQASPPPVAQAPSAAPANLPSPPHSANVTVRSPPPVNLVSPPPQSPPAVYAPNPHPPAPVTLPSFTGSIPQAPAQVELVYDPKLMGEAEKHARFIVSSIQFEDIDEAMRQCNQTMALLQRLRQQGQ